MRAAAQQALEALEFANEQAVCAHHDDQAHVYRAAIEALRTALAQPEGWQLVPKEPTREMCAAAVKFANGNAVYKNVAAEALEIEESIYGEAYEAMIAAAPGY